MFKGVAHIGKAEGQGETNSFPKIEDQDMEKLSTYFINIMQGPPNSAKLQEIVLFNVIYYMAHQGHENLRQMKKTTFGIDQDCDGKCFIFQKIKEHDKNHRLQYAAKQ